VKHKYNPAKITIYYELLTEPTSNTNVPFSFNIQWII